MEEKEKKKEKEGQRAWPSALQGAGLTVRNPEPSSLANPRREAGLRESSAVVIPRLGAGRYGLSISTFPSNPGCVRLRPSEYHPLRTCLTSQIRTCFRKSPVLQSSNGV
jgi:hypothetical protein